ncbi:hypothetical protein CSQ96_27820 [Janthinobacterium sp. BJB412]|nr:hypothetical protein CSQ96_27820 [Janthinobacterium sp. BJB412]
MTPAAARDGSALLVAGVLLVLLLALCLGLFFYVLRAARRRAAAAPAEAAAGAAATAAMAAAAAAPDTLAARLDQALDAAFASAREWVSSGRSNEEVPLVWLAGEPGSGKSSLLRMADGGDDAGQGVLSWHRLPQGWVLETDASYLGLDDKAGAPGWRALAEKLQRNRPRRPLDAVLLTLPADSLLGQDAWPLAEVERRAALVQQSLAEMQSLLGLRLPVYLLITRADALTGFGAFAESLPPGLRQAMLGWSNPQQLEAAFSPDWGRDAFVALRRQVCALQAELLAAGRPPADSDSFFQLAGQVDRLGAPVGAYLARLMGASAHGEAPLLRGVYLCGDPAAAPGRAEPLFIRDLLAFKVFPERALARPLRGQHLSRDKRVRRWVAASAALALLWGGALLWAALDLRGRADALLATLGRIEQEQRIRSDGVAKYGALPFTWYQSAAQGLMDSMLGHDDSLVYLAIPASWHWPGRQGLDQRIDQRFTEGLENIVLRTLAKGLNLQAVALSGVGHDAVSTELTGAPSCELAPLASGGAATVLLSDSPSFAALHRLVDGTVTFEQWQARFDRLQNKDEGTIEDLGNLGAYTKAYTLRPEQHPEHHRYLREALRGTGAGGQTKLAPRGAYEASMVCAFRLNSERFLTQTLDEHRALQLAVAVDQELRSGIGQADGHRFDQLQRQLHELGRWLGAPGTRWLSGQEGDFGKPYAALLEQVGKSAMLGPQAAHALREETQKRVLALGQRLLAAGGDSPVLQRGSDGGKLELVPEVAHMEAGLGALLKQPFMQLSPGAVAGAAGEGAAGDGGGALVTWDMNVLNRTLLMVAEQRAYMGRVLAGFPFQFQAELQSVADQRLAANLLAGVALARSRTSDPQEAWQRLGQSQKLLTALLDAVRSQGTPAQYRGMADKLAQQAAAGLRWLQGDFQAGAPYRPREGGFNWWQGSPNPAAQGFAGGQAAALEEYLLNQHAQLENSVKLAQPLLRLLESADAGAAEAAATASGHGGIADYWRGLAAELARFQSKHPNSRITQLDNYIRGELAETDLQNCSGRGGAVFASGANDFFALRGRMLASQMAVRCQELVRGGAISAYQSLSAAFRQNLAGRFPFADVGHEGETADIDDVATFFRSVDRYAAAAARQPPDARARDFVGAAERARTLLAPLLAPADGGDAPGYEISVRFRVNERGESDGNNQLRGELEGNRIVDWTLQSGERSVAWHSGTAGAAQTLPWRLGMPLVLTLRWAENTPTLPYRDGRDLRMSVQGRDVVYRFNEPWSLLRLLAGYRVAPPAGTAPRYETLRFEIPTAPQAAGATVAAARARVFMRLALSPAGKKEALAYSQLPVDAPVSDNLEQVRNVQMREAMMNTPPPGGAR